IAYSLRRCQGNVSPSAADLHAGLGNRCRKQRSGVAADLVRQCHQLDGSLAQPGHHLVDTSADLLLMLEPRLEERNRLEKGMLVERIAGHIDSVLVDVN